MAMTTAIITVARTNEIRTVDEGRGRSPRRWAGRIALAAGFAALGVVATGHTLGYALRNADSRRALAINPADARLLGVRALALAQPSASAADLAEARRLARSALQRDATAVTAVDALAFLTLFQGHEHQGRTLFGYATHLSRRDLRSQVWAIEDAVGHGNVRGALLHYDIALRTSSEGPELLFPVLAAAIADPAIRAALVDRLAGRPLWSEAFVSHLADEGPDFVAAAALLADLRRRKIVTPDYVRTSLIGRLVERGTYDAAWRYYASATPGVDRRRSRDHRFAATLANPTAFDWTPLGDAGVSASLQRGDTGGVLAFNAAPSIGGPLVRQLQVLPAGRYMLVGRSADIDQPRGSWPYWSLACADGREIGRVEAPASALNGGRFAGTLVVPANCPAQWLTLNARPSDNPQGLGGAIQDAELRPLPPG